MKKVTYLWLSLVLVIMSCSSSNVTVEKELYKDFDLSKYKTYSFLEVDSTDSHIENFELAVDYLKEEFNRHMTSRGLTLDNDNPQLQINLGIAIEDKEQTRETSLATDPFMYTGQRNYTWKSEEIVVNKYKEGTLQVHLVDAETNNAAWVGVVSKIIPNKLEKKQTAIESAVLEVFQSIENLK